jgi:hypothetical protein
MFKSIVQRYRRYVPKESFILGLASGLALLAASLVVNYYAALYANDRASSSVTDIILSNTPVMDVDAIFIYGPIVFWLIIAAFCIHDPRKIPFILKNIALFIFVRSFFITLTHIGPFPDHVVTNVNSGILDLIHASSNFFIFSTGSDLFFSGHTGLPFLMALVFWEYKPMRIFCILSALFFGVIVLLGHLHYSIDVLSAFFITYTIFHIAEKFFPNDQHMFIESHSSYMVQTANDR